MENQPRVTWLEVAWACAMALMGAALTYGTFYGGKLYDDGGLSTANAPEFAMFALSVALGGLLAAGLFWHRLLRPAGLLAGFLVFGHTVWAVVAIDVSAAFVLSNWCEMAVAMLLIHAASEARTH